MQEFILMLAKFTPEGEIIREIDEAMKEYKLHPTESNKSQLGIWCMLLSMKLSTEDMTLGELKAGLERHATFERAFEKNRS